VRGDFIAALRQAKELLVFAEGRGDPVGRLIGHYASGLSCLPLGEFNDVRQHLGNGLLLFDPARRADYAAPVIGDPRVLMRLYLAWCLMCEGRIAACRAESEAALGEARQLGQFWTLAQTLSTRSYFALMLDSPQAALRELDELALIAKEHRFVYFDAMGTALRGWCIAALGDPHQGSAMLRAGIDLLRGMRSLLWVPSLVRMHAEALGWAGEISDALRRLDDAFHITAETRAHWDLSEMFRVRGELLAAGGEAAAAEDTLADAVVRARKLGARLFELRAAVSLARLCARRRRRNEAAAALVPVLRQFDDSADALDLRNARTLLADLHSTSPAVA
jgi:predicted ATPase